MSSVRPYSVPTGMRVPVCVQAACTPVNPTRPMDTSASAENRGTSSRISGRRPPGPATSSGHRTSTSSPTIPPIQTAAPATCTTWAMSGVTPGSAAVWPDATSRMIPDSPVAAATAPAKRGATKDSAAAPTAATSARAV